MVDDSLRFAVLLAERFKEFVERAAADYDTFELYRFLMRVAAWYLAEDHGASVSFVVYHLVLAGLRTLGLLHSFVPQRCDLAPALPSV